MSPEDDQQPLWREPDPDRPSLPPLDPEKPPVDRRGEPGRRVPQKILGAVLLVPGAILLAGAAIGDCAAQSAGGQFALPSIGTIILGAIGLGLAYLGWQLWTGGDR